MHDCIYITTTDQWVKYATGAMRMPKPGTLAGSERISFPAAKHDGMRERVR
jgi:hypothetical protein